MSEKILLGVVFLVFVIGFYYFYDEIFDFITEPDMQVDIGQALGITRQSDKR